MTQLPPIDARDEATRYPPRPEIRLRPNAMSATPAATPTGTPAGAPVGTSTGTPTGTPTMPAEWARHARTWMELPAPDLGARTGFGPAGSAPLASAQLAWAAVANALVGFEPVTMLVPPGYTGAARRELVSGVRIDEAPTGSSRLRDRGPTFVHTGDGSLHAVSWAPGGAAGRPVPDSGPEEALARAAGAVPVRSALALAGGALRVDGEGTALLVGPAVLDPHRNPGWTRAGVEAELHARLGVTTVLWLPGRIGGERGRAQRSDLPATFVRPGVVLVHDQSDPGHPDHPGSRECIERLRRATDARGRRLTVIPLPAPRAGRVGGGWSTYSYLDHYVANGVVLLGVFDDPADRLAGHLLRRVYRGREVVMLDARPISAAGGGIHSITQQQPARAGRPPAESPIRPRHGGLRTDRRRQGGLPPGRRR